MLDSRAKTKPRIIVISTDADFAQTARAAFNAKIIPGFSLIESALNSPAAERAVCAAAIVVADLGAPEQTDQDLSEFRHLMSRISGDLPVVAVVDTFNDVIARKLVQIKVADILVKPVAPIELLRACTRLAQSKNDDSQIYTFLPVAGGVGTTVLAIQSALTLLGGQAGKDRSTCLVDLNFRHGACADYLDIDARLNLKEIGLNPERLDGQLLESMLSHHPSGLAVVAAPNLPTESAAIEPNIVMGLLNVVCQCFDQVVIDMPKDWQPWTDNIVFGSNRLFLVGEATVPGLRKAKQLAEIISGQVGQGPRPKVIVNRFERRLFSPGLRYADIATILGDTLAGTVPFNHRLVREAIDRGVPLDEIRKNSDVAVAIKRLVAPRRLAKPRALFQRLVRSSSTSNSAATPNSTLNLATR